MNIKKIKIIGGQILKGTLSIETNKNAVLPVLCASLLSNQDCILKNIPRSPDVIKIVEAINLLGGICVWMEENTLCVNCKNLRNDPVPNCVADIQSAILFVGPLLARFGEVSVPVAIGCKLGYRGPEDHIDYLSRFGVHSIFDTKSKRVIFNVDRDYLTENALVCKNITETTTKHFIFSEASVTPTENLLMFLSCVTLFESKIEGIAQEPHVKFLTSVLRQIGMNIQGEGSTLVCSGTFLQNKGFECDFYYEPDYIDFYGHAVMTALSGGEVFLECYVNHAIIHMVGFLEKTGVSCSISKKGVLIDGKKSNFVFSQGFPKAIENVYKMNPRPWPGFPVDSLPSLIALVAQHGYNHQITVLNWMYEDGLSYVPQLVDLGAKITLYDTGYGAQKVSIQSYKEKFSDHNVQITLPGVPVIEGIRALISYALSQKGKEITIENISPILRRSPRFIDKLKAIGADITVL